jgi:hypothetical protein
MTVINLVTTPNEALAEAISRGLDAVAVVGTTEDGALYLRTSGDMDRGELLFLLEQAKLIVLGVFDE